MWADELRGTPAARARWHYDDAAGVRQRRAQGALLPRRAMQQRAAQAPDRRCWPIPHAARASATRRSSGSCTWSATCTSRCTPPTTAIVAVTSVQVALSGRTHARARESAPGLGRGLGAAGAADAAAASSRRPTSPRWPARRSSCCRRPARGSPDSWALESNNLARNVAYHYAGFVCDTRPRVSWCWTPSTSRLPPGSSRERLLLAGARLAALLNQALDGS